MAPKKSTASVAGGMVSVGLGIRMSADFQSAAYDVGLSLPINEGESVEEALSRVHAEANKGADSTMVEQMDRLATDISSIKKAFKDKVGVRGK